MTTIIGAIKKATHSALFCLFSPTDKDMLQAFFDLADEHRMMLGLVNSVSDKDPADAKYPQQGLMMIYDRSKKAHKVDLVGHGQFGKDAPTGFWQEDSSVTPGSAKSGQGGPPVYVHHKFIVIDGETDHPTIYTGSANMSNNSAFNNDENIMEITGSTRLAEIYLAEFMRLFEHYRARFSYNLRQGAAGKKKQPREFTLTKDKSWNKDWYDVGSSKSNSRIALAQTAAANSQQIVTSTGVRTRRKRG
jgi:PLD-like domain